MGAGCSKAGLGELGPACLFPAPSPLCLLGTQVRHFGYMSFHRFCKDSLLPLEPEV